MFDFGFSSSNKFWNFSPAFIGVNLLIALGIMVGFCPECFTSIERLEKIGPSFFLTFLISVALSYGGNLIEDFFDARMPWIAYPAKRFILEAALYMLYTFCVSYVLMIIFVLWIDPMYTLENIPWIALMRQTRLPLILGFVISSILISRSFLIEWRKAAIEAEQLKTERYARQYQSLKDQLNPHFLFNSLNVLSDLVYDNPDDATHFIRKLSNIYRYVLEVQQEELVTLEKEIEFASNYLSLQKVRFGDSLKYDIPEVKEHAGFLPPLSLQLLLENAIKHNVASRQNPLHIAISIVDGSVLVQNNIQLKSSGLEESTGIGLANIRRRYDLLSSENLEIMDKDKMFIVKLPILKGVKPQ